MPPFRESGMCPYPRHLYVFAESITPITVLEKSKELQTSKQ
jgi:hypothetical protein